ncbi:hypothetical protein ACU4GD_12060 [Cupriavidus basilensis]
MKQQHATAGATASPGALLTGDDAAIARLLPELAEQGWLITSDAVLPWSKTNKEGWPDADWLKALYRLRRRRPVDAVILTTDSAAGSAGAAPRLHPRWHAPGAHRRIAALVTPGPPAVDVAEARTVAHGTSCPGHQFAKLPRQADADAIDGALRTLRDQLAQRVVAATDGEAAATATWESFPSGSNPHPRQGARRLDRRTGGPAAPAHPRGQHRLCAAIHGLWPAMRACEQQHDLPLWHYLGEAARRQPGQRVGWHPVTVSAIVGLTAIGLWSAGMLVSGVRNAQDVSAAQQVIQDVRRPPTRLPACARSSPCSIRSSATSTAPGITRRLRRFGLNRDPAVLAALWKPTRRPAASCWSRPCSGIWRRRWWISRNCGPRCWMRQPTGWR